jgi:hypothetical protein
MENFRVKVESVMQGSEHRVEKFRRSVSPLRNGDAICSEPYVSNYGGVMSTRKNWQTFATISKLVPDPRRKIPVFINQGRNISLQFWRKSCSIAENMAPKERSKIVEWYDGKSIFITGGSGFMGKVLVEKLLYSCSGVKQIYILIRAKRGKEPQTRIQEMWTLPVS